MPEAGLWGQVDTGYDRHRERMAERSSEQSRSGRDIGRVPAVVNPERRESTRRDFRLFCETYFSGLFPLAWSPDHLRVLALVEDSVLRGGLAAVAMPRGSGKTTILSDVAPLWAILHGHCRYAVVIGPEANHAHQIVEGMVVALETNEALGEDFPEACHPVAALEGIRQRANGQLCDGAPTRVRLTERKIVFPTIKGSACSGAVVEACGITGRLRGLKHALPDGTSIRPDLVLVDDPQTEESARSPTQVETREAILDNAVLGLAGPGQSIAGLAAVTVIEPDDLADRLLDNEAKPEWRAERCKALYAMPDRLDLWEQYGELYEAGLPTGDTGAAQEFYRANREAMDAGARVAWPERHRPDELSGLEHCMRIHLVRPLKFAAEYQNQPVRPDQDGENRIPTVAELLERPTSGVPRGVVPQEAELLTAMVDVQGRALFWTVVAWSRGFRGWVVDYGVFPDQGRQHYSLRDIKKTLLMNAPGAGEEGAIHKGLEDLAGTLLGRQWPREGGGELPLDRLLVDAGWQTETVFAWARSSAWAARVIPSRGRYYGASAKPIHERARKPGDRVGPSWFIAAPGDRRSIRAVTFDSNYWKSFAIARLATAPGDRGAALFFEEKARAHRLYAEHLTSEDRVRVTASSGRAVDEWKLKRGRDNHFLDTFVGCCVAASISGASLLEGEDRTVTRKRRRRRTAAEVQAALAGARDRMVW